MVQGSHPGSEERACVLSRFSRAQLCDPVDCSPPGSSVPGTLQVRILEWVACRQNGTSPERWAHIVVLSGTRGGMEGCGRITFIYTVDSQLSEHSACGNNILRWFSNCHAYRHHLQRFLIRRLWLRPGIYFDKHPRCVFSERPTFQETPPLGLSQQQFHGL